MQPIETIVIVPIHPALRSRIQPLIDEAWAGPMLAINGKLWNTRTLPGIAALDASDTLLGYLLYAIHDGVCEIMLLESLRENLGVGTRLIERVKVIAKEQQIQKVIVITTNDNIRAIRFYQRRGFTLRALRPNALEHSRQLKPGIPLMSEDGIPLRDEIEFEINV